MMSVFNTPEAVKDLKQSISNYFAQKAEAEIDQLWADGILTEGKVESFRSLIERTPYNVSVVNIDEFLSELESRFS